MPLAAGFEGVYFFSLKGDMIMCRTFRDDEDPAVVTKTFRENILNERDTAINTPAPVQRIVGRGTYMYMKYKDVYLLIVMKVNTNAMMAARFLSDFIRLLRSYLQTPLGGDLSEDAIRQNFVVIYELLDEAVDFGYPQITDPSVLKAYITQRTLFAKIMNEMESEGNRNAKTQSATLQVTGAVKHRPDGIKYKKNEVYLDLIENCNVLVSGTGDILRADVQGRFVMKSSLSGMPDIKLGLSERNLDNVVFHQCVNSNKYQTDKVVSFVPPDGEFELMRYSCTEGIQLPFKVIPVIKELSGTRMQIDVKLRGTFSPKLFALNVVVRIPVPKYTGRTELLASYGKVKFDAAKNQVVWKIKKMAGGMEGHLACELGMIQTIRDMKPWPRPPLQVEFQIPSFSASGLRVQYLKVWEKTGYNVERWVRKVCKGGDYTVRYPLGTGSAEGTLAR